ncbi:MAG: discoidin domain-containing protein [Chlamydiota bacterium]|nr:discoidin domain-containing protein [Chlamydiota bacterium]
MNYSNVNIFFRVTFVLYLVMLPSLARVDADVTYRLKIRSVLAASEQVPDPIKQETYEADHVRDNAIWTRWSSDFEDRQWLVLDLGRDATVSRIVIRWEDAFAVRYTTRLSMDGVKWLKVKNLDNAEGGNETLNFDPHKARYIRFDFIERATEWGFSIWEIEVHGHY